MALTNPEKKNAIRWLRRKLHVGKTANVTKFDILAALDAADDWFDAVPAGGASNQAAAVAALPAAFRGGTDAPQKGLIIAAVALVRSGAI